MTHNALINILFVIPTLNGGGAERVFINILRSLNKEKFNISLLLQDKSGVFTKLLPSDIKIVTLKSKKTRFNFISLLKNIKIINPQIIVSTTNRMNILVLLTSLLKKEAKIIIREPNMPSAQINNKQLPFYYLWLIKLLYPRANHIIAQTEAMKSDITNIFNIPKDKVIVLTNPIDKQYIIKQSESSINPYNNDKINLVASGRLTEAKGFEFLIRSFSKVVQQNHRFVLNILGVGSDNTHKNRLLKLSKELQVENNIIFHGFIDDPFPYYKHAHLFVLSSKWEGLPNVVLEALFLKTPVLVRLYSIFP